MGFSRTPMPPPKTNASHVIFSPGMPERHVPAPMGTHPETGQNAARDLGCSVFRAWWRLFRGSWLVPCLGRPA